MTQTVHPQLSREEPMTNRINDHDGSAAHATAVDRWMHSKPAPQDTSVRRAPPLTFYTYSSADMGSCEDFKASETFDELLHGCPRRLWRTAEAAQEAAMLDLRERLEGCAEDLGQLDGLTWDESGDGEYTISIWEGCMAFVVYQVKVID